METSDIDLSVPSAARVYDYLLGGVDNLAVDREAAEAVLRVAPDSKRAAWANRAWLGRVVRFSVAARVTQFLDIGSGLPTRRNVHEVAQWHDLTAKVAYYDNDPIVLAHSRALLANNPLTRYALLDARDPAAILDDAAELLDFDQPVALILGAVLNWIPTSDDPAKLVSRYASDLPPGSLIAITHPTSDATDPELLDVIRATYGGRLVPRSEAAIAEMFCGLDLFDPGLVDIELWRPDHPDQPGPLRLLGGVALVP